MSGEEGNEIILLLLLFKQLHLVSPGPAMSQPWRVGAGEGWTGERPIVGPGRELGAFGEECGISLPLSLV